MKQSKGDRQLSKREGVSHINTQRKRRLRDINTIKELERDINTDRKREREQERETSTVFKEEWSERLLQRQSEKERGERH